VRLRGVRRIFAGRAVLDGVDLEVRKGEFVALLGPSGTGKTTLLRILAGLDRADEGEVKVAAARSVVFQEPRLVPALKVWRNVVIGHPRNAAARKLAAAALDEVGLLSHADAWPRTLSGGEAQRVALARALALHPEVLVADEAVSALDVSVQAQVLKLLAELRERLKLSIVFITHDLRVAAQICDLVAVMKDGEVVEQGPTNEVFGKPWHPYTRALLASIPGGGTGARAKA